MGGLILLTLFLLYLRLSPSEHAKGFYFVRPVGWEVEGSTLRIYLYSPHHLHCIINGVPLDLNGLGVYSLKGDFRPGSYRELHLDINCGTRKEQGSITVFITT